MKRDNMLQVFEPHRFDPEILREYDIRGEVGVNLSGADALAVGLAFGTFVRRKGGSRICVGYDGRLTSPAFADAAIRGLIATGMNVEAIGLGPTPMLSFAVKDRMADAGLMITGSHNPAGHNGFKMTLQTGPIYGETVQKIGRIAAAADYETGQGTIHAVDMRDSYVERLLKDFEPMEKTLNVVWDCGNGAAGAIVRMLTARLPGRHMLLHDEIDGRFPNHHPDPTVDKNLGDLIQAVKKNGFDLGVAFDGDADRIGAVDEQGNILRCDTLLAIYARDVLQRHKGAPVVGDVKCSQVMYDEIRRLGGQPVMWKTGHSLIKAKMAELKAPLAGELSGHIFFGDKWYGFDDGIYCAIRLMNEAAKAGGPVSSLTAALPRTFSTPEIRIEVDEKRKFDLVKEIAASVRAGYPGAEVIDIDGVRVTAAEGWWLLRASNTQSMLVARAEADSPEHLSLLKTLIRKEVEKIGYGVTL